MVGQSSHPPLDGRPPMCRAPFSRLAGPPHLYVFFSFPLGLASGYVIELLALNLLQASVYTGFAPRRSNRRPFRTLFKRKKRKIFTTFDSDTDPALQLFHL